jgi:hypothetical protein
MISKIPIKKIKNHEKSKPLNLSKPDFNYQQQFNIEIANLGCGRQ